MALSTRKRKRVKELDIPQTITIGNSLRKTSAKISSKKTISQQSDYKLFNPEALNPALVSANKSLYDAHYNIVKPFIIESIIGRPYIRTSKSEISRQTNLTSRDITQCLSSNKILTKNEYLDFLNYVYYLFPLKFMTWKQLPVPTSEAVAATKRFVKLCNERIVQGELKDKAMYDKKNNSCHSDSINSSYNFQSNNGNNNITNNSYNSTHTHANKTQYTSYNGVSNRQLYPYSC